MATAPFAYPKSRRLRKRRDFLRVQDRSARVTTRHFVLLLAPRLEEGPCRLGIVASKKVGCAVVRNRIKRLLREAFRHRYGIFPAGIDLVIIARPGADLSLSEVTGELDAVAGLVHRRSAEVLRAASTKIEAGPCALAGRVPKCRRSGAVSR